MVDTDAVVDHHNVWPAVIIMFVVVHSIQTIFLLLIICSDLLMIWHADLIYPSCCLALYSEEVPVQGGLPFIQCLLLSLPVQQQQRHKQIIMHRY